MSVLKKYRDSEEDRDARPSTVERHRVAESTSRPVVAVPNKERKSPIVSFSFSTELRSCLQNVRNEKAINLSMWVERKLREALSNDFPDLADKYLD